MSAPGPSIVAIIPLYNGAKFIKEAVDSVLTQTLKPAEFLIIDDGSTDDGPAIVEQLARSHPIKLLHKPNGGQASARNFGVANSNSALIALLDQDDAWYPQHLERLVEPFLQNRDDLGWVYSNIDLTDEAGDLRQAGLLNLVAHHPKTSLKKCHGEDMHILPSASLINRKAFLSVGGFDERLSGYEDDDLFTRIFSAGYRNIYINEPLSLWRHHSTNSGFSPRMTKSATIYARKSLRAFPEHRDAIINRFLRVAWWTYSEVAKPEAAKRDVTPLLRALIPYMPLKLALRTLFATVLLNTKQDKHFDIKRLIRVKPPEAPSSPAAAAAAEQGADRVQNLSAAHSERNA